MNLFFWLQAVNGRNIRGPIQEPEVGEEEYAWRRQDEDEAPRYIWPRRTEVEVEHMVQDAYARADEIHEEATANPVDFGNLPNENEEVRMADWEQLVAESTEKVYEGCRVNRLQASIVVLNMVNTYGIPYTFLDELLCFLAGDLLPQSNCLPRTTYEMKSMLMKMGLEHVAIHCCSSGHILYKGSDHQDLVDCLVYGESRYISGSTTVPQKVLRYFPIIPRLQRLFQCPEVADLLKWHASNKSINGYMRFVVDSQQWAAVQEIDPTFRDEEANLYMGLVADGVNPFGNQSTKYSMWSVLLVMYNLPPWLVSKNFFIALSLLIPGDKAPSGEAFDIFMKPLVRDFLKLWSGV